MIFQKTRYHSRNGCERTQATPHGIMAKVQAAMTTDRHLSTNVAGERDMFKVVMMLTQGLILPFLVWLGVQMVEQRESIARLEVRLENQTAVSADRYTATQAAADRRTQANIDATQNRDIGRLEEQVTSLRRQLDGLE